MAHPSPIRTNTAKQARSSTKGRLWAPRDPSPNPQPRKNLWSTVSGENSSTHSVLLLSVPTNFGTVKKENVCCGCSDRTALSEKKTVLKPKSPEKSRPDEKDVEKSPAKKTDGQPLITASYFNEVYLRSTLQHKGCRVLAACERYLVLINGGDRNANGY